MLYCCVDQFVLSLILFYVCISLLLYLDLVETSLLSSRGSPLLGIRVLVCGIVASSVLLKLTASPLGAGLSEIVGSLKD